MTLSNTATPKYYGQFRDAVLRGDIPICREIEMEMNRIDRLIEDPAYHYDDEAIDGFIRFCEAELTQTNGDDLVLLDSFKLWAESLLAWYYYSTRNVWVPTTEFQKGHFEEQDVLLRLRTKQYLIVARGAAKSMYAMMIHAYFLTCDTSTTHQVTTAPTMKQAEEVLSPLRTAIVRSKGPFFDFLTEGSLQNTIGSRNLRQKLASTKKVIENLLTKSILEIRPMTIDKLQGLRSQINTIDEWLSGEIREDPVGAIEGGASKHDEYIILAISSEGTVRNGVGDDMKIELATILKQDVWKPEISIWHYKLDDVAEVGQPEMWSKANPNLGYTVSYEAYQKDVERAEIAPAARNDILAKRFGLPMEGFSFFFTWPECQPHRKKNYDGMVCALGADLSQGDDFCAFTFLFPLRAGQFGVKTRCYISSLTWMRLPPSLKTKYQGFVDEDSLKVLECNILDMVDVYDDLDQWVEKHEYEIVTMGYDPYNAKEFVNNYTRDNGPFGIEKVIQGMQTESVPLGNIKKLATERDLLFDEELFKFAMGNSVVIEDTNGNRKILKRRYSEKIDPVSALMDAFVAYTLHKDNFE